MFVQDHHSLEELQRLTKALRLETRAQLVIDSSCVPVSILKQWADDPDRPWTKPKPSVMRGRLGRHSSI